MEELKTAANGLEGLLSDEADKCIGILNGIDTQVWDTTTDSYLKMNYTATRNPSGKKANKKWICDTYDLDMDKPLFVFIGRLVYEKGSDLFPEAFKQVLNHQEVSILLLGSGDTETEQRLLDLKDKFKGKYNAYIGYNEELSHVIYAGADFLLMPSRVEPCGLNQMYSLRYGTIPVVRSIGGLKDTIVDVEDGGFGFTHPDTTVEQMVSSIKRAATLFKDQKKFKKIRKQIMSIDHSWNRSASIYIQLYNSITN
jgi:starch synthase